MQLLLISLFPSIFFQSIVSEVPQIILRCVSRDEAGLAVAQKVINDGIFIFLSRGLRLSCAFYYFYILVQVFKALYENGGSGLHTAAHLAILAAIRDVCKLVVKELTSWVCLYEYYDLS